MAISNHDHGTVVAVVAFLIADDVDVQVITVLQLVAIWDAVANDIVDTGADALRELMEADSGRVRSIGHDIVMYKCVDFVQCHAYLCVVERMLQCSGAEICGQAKVFDFCFGVDVNLVRLYIGVLLWPLIHVGWSDYVFRHFSWWCYRILVDL